MKELAELLKETRENSGIELSEVSKDINVDELILLNIEQGKIGAFKDIFLLKEYIRTYSKYLGLDSEELLEQFNEYFFEYTSRIPIEKIEKQIKENIKESDDDKISSPYTMEKSKNKNGMYIFIYILLLILIALTIFWSINQITIEKKNAYVVSYRK